MLYFCPRSTKRNPPWSLLQQDGAPGEKLIMIFSSSVPSPCKQSHPLPSYLQVQNEEQKAWMLCKCCSATVKRSLVSTAKQHCTSEKKKQNSSSQTQHNFHLQACSSPWPPPWWGSCPPAWTHTWNCSILKSRIQHLSFLDFIKSDFSSAPIHPALSVMLPGELMVPSNLFSLAHCPNSGPGEHSQGFGCQLNVIWISCSSFGSVVW